MKLGIEIEHDPRHFYTNAQGYHSISRASWAISVTIPWHFGYPACNISDPSCMTGWGWKAKTWRFYYGNF
jgi:hypothetical protein